MEKWFEKLPRLVQFLLLLIPGVNWIIEVLVRWSHALRTKKTAKIVLAVLVTIFGVLFGWIDMISVLLTKHLLFCK